MFEIGELMDIRVFNTEPGPGRENPELCEAKLMRSLDELVPIMEEKGIRLDIQAHPDDFYEHNNDAYDIIRYYGSPSLGYLYSIPHTFHYDGGKGDIEHNLKYTRKHLKHMLFADTYNYTKLFRYNINPAPLYANGTVRCLRTSAIWARATWALRASSRPCARSASTSRRTRLQPSTRSASRSARFRMAPAPARSLRKTSSACPASPSQCPKALASMRDSIIFS